MTEVEREAEAEKQLHKLGITISQEEETEKTKTEDKGINDAYNLMPDSIRKQLPKNLLYSTERNSLEIRLPMHAISSRWEHTQPTSGI